LIPSNWLNVGSALLLSVTNVNAGTAPLLALRAVPVAAFGIAVDVGEPLQALRSVVATPRAAAERSDRSIAPRVLCMATPYRKSRKRYREVMVAADAQRSTKQADSQPDA
jgi:hypothetical protein